MLSGSNLPTCHAFQHEHGQAYTAVHPMLGVAPRAPSQPAAAARAPQDLPAAERALGAEHGPALAPPGFAAQAGPRACHLDSLCAAPPSLAPPAQQPGQPALRPLSQPAQLFGFDFAAPPAGGRTADLQARGPVPFRAVLHATPLRPHVRHGRSHALRPSPGCTGAGERAAGQQPRPLPACWHLPGGEHGTCAGLRVAAPPASGSAVKVASPLACRWRPRVRGAAL